MVTKKQHYVPRFYLERWYIKNETKVWLYDLMNRSVEKKGIKRILSKDHYYEHDPNNPDNTVENELARFEGQAGVVFSQIAKAVDNHPALSDEHKLRSVLKPILGDTNLAVLKAYLSYQYLRVPDVLAQKAFELKFSGLPREFLDRNLKPANFVTTGREHTKDKFAKLNMAFCYSFDYDFVTSDRPCFDFDKSKNSPLIGTDLERPGVHIIFPLSPKILIVLAKHFPKDIRVVSISGGEARNTNTLIIQRADRWIIYNRKADFIFKVAEKRLRDK